MIRPIAAACLTMLAIGLADPAAAYVGPGLGAGSIAVILGIIGSVLLAIVGVVWYPLKRMMKKRKKATAGGVKDGVAADGDSVQPPR